MPPKTISIRMTAVKTKDLQHVNRCSSGVAHFCKLLALRVNPGVKTDQKEQNWASLWEKRSSRKNVGQGNYFQSRFNERREDNDGERQEFAIIPALDTDPPNARTDSRTGRVTRTGQKRRKGERIAILGGNAAKLMKIPA